MNQTRRIIAWIFTLLAVLLLAALVAIQSSSVQTYLGKRLVRSIESSTDAQVSIGSISIRPLEALVLSNVVMLDRTPYHPEADTLLYVQSLSVKFSLRGLFQGKGAYISRLRLSGGGFFLVIEPNPADSTASTTNIQRVLRITSSGEETDLSWGNLLTAKQAEIKDFHFRMENPRSALRRQQNGSVTEPGVIDWNHLGLTVHNLQVQQLRIADNFVTTEAVRAQFQENATRLQFREVEVQKIRVGNALARLEDVWVSDGFTQLDLEHFALEGKLDDYSYFEDRIVLEAQMRDRTLLDMGHTISHFASLKGITFRGYGKGRIRGTVNRLALENVRVTDADNGVSLQATGFVHNAVAPDGDLGKCRIDFTVRELTFDLRSLGGFVHAWSAGTQLDLKQFAPGERFRFEGKVKGPLQNLQISGQASSGIGRLMADLSLRNVLDDHAPILLGGQLATSNFHLGKLLGTSSLGPVSMRTRTEATIHTDGSIGVKTDTLQVVRLQALGYDYSGISGRFSYQNETLTGRLRSTDPNFNFFFDGQLDLDPDKADGRYLASLDVNRANLHAMNLDPRERSVVSFKARSDLYRSGKETLDGTLYLQDITLESQEVNSNIGGVVITPKQKSGQHSLHLNSNFLELDYQGSQPVLRFAQDIRRAVLAAELSALTDEQLEPLEGSAYQLALKVLDAQDLLTFLKPGLYIENKTEAGLSITRDGSLQAKLHSGRLALDDKYIKDLLLEADNRGSALNASLSGATLALGSTRFLDNRLQLRAQDNQVNLGYTFDNKDGGQNRALVSLQARLSREAQTGLGVIGQILPSVFVYHGSGWEFSSDRLSYNGGEVSINGLQAWHGQQSLKIDGILSPERTDTLTVRMDQFDLSLANTLFGGNPEVAGLATGRALLLSPTQPSPGLLASILCDSVKVSGRPMGTLYLASNRDDENGRYTASARNFLNGRTTLNAEAFYSPSSREMEAKAQFQGLDLGYAAPFLESLFSEFSGRLDGELGMSGTLEKPHFHSNNLQVSDGHIRLDYTQVPYSVDGSLDLRDEGLFFTPLRLTDSQGGTGRIEGGLLFGNLNDIGLDTHIRVDGMQVLGLSAEQNDSFFGTLAAAGKADVSGTLSRILLQIDATPLSGEIHVPLGGQRGDSSRELLTFTDPASKLEKDPYELMMAARSQHTESRSRLDVELRVRATPDAQVFIDVDDESSLQGAGQGIIDLVSRGGDFTMNGDYTLSSGNFHFSTMNLVSRDFTIQDGSSVRFNGDLWNTDLNVNGLYATKASLYNLTADETANTRRTVNCGIQITGKLQNPELNFSIDVPDLNPTMQAQVDAALNTEDKIQKQFIYLLVAGSFLPSEESGISIGGSDMLFSNVSSIMAGQLNNIFQKLDIPLDLGLNYKSTQTGSNLFDVAVSTQLFNNRVLVNGTVGNKQQLGGTTTNEVAGDIDIEIKLNRSGSLRMNLFTHSADQLSAYLDNSQRHGGGIAFQREFNSFGQFVRDLFSSREKREQRAQEEALQPVRNVVMQIDSTGKAQSYELR